jgi:hypothetical protein
MPLFHTVSTGCMVLPPFIEGYRGEVDAYLEKQFPGFPWEQVGKVGAGGTGASSTSSVPRRQLQRARVAPQGEEDLKRRRDGV